MLQALIGPIANLASTFMEGRQQKSAAKAELQLTNTKAEIELLNRKMTGDIDWDVEMAKASVPSWKDEWLTLLFSIPLVLAFCGEWGREIVFEGFKALEQMPQFYQYTLGVIVSASFATRSAAKFFGKKK